MKYSIIVPVFNRPDEVDELLESLCSQTLKDFEVVIVEDGSEIPSKDVCDKYANILDLHYYQKDNSGPGQSRNYGAERAKGDWLIILDSDVVLPPGYMESVEQNTQRSTLNTQLACWGGPDASHPSFTPVQKAISYSMTSFFTTGGIRGGKKKLDKFYPRSFNMGIRREVYTTLGGFSKMRFGEDIDFSIRIFKGGYRCRLFPEAWVWHKRRTDFRKFFRQVYNSGIARINLFKKYPESLKLVHLLPAVFTLGTLGCIALSTVGFVLNINWLGWSPLALLGCYVALVFVDATVVYKSVKIGALSVAAAFVQLMGYGFGFLEAWWKRCVKGESEFQAFEKNFYA